VKGNSQLDLLVVSLCGSSNNQEDHAAAAGLRRPLVRLHFETVVGAGLRSRVLRRLVLCALWLVLGASVLVSEKQEVNITLCSYHY